MRDKFGRFRKGHNWKGGLPKCKDCGKQLGDRRAKRCKSCNIKFLHSSGILNYFGKNNPFYGKKHSEKFLKRLSLRNKKRIGKNALHWKGGVSKKYKKCIDCGGKLGDYYSVRCRECYDEFKKGSNHWNWQGGKSFEPYPLGWNKTFKEQIRYRDGYKCQICGIPEIEHGRKLDVHHKDYDKMNIKPENLISLCNSCHIKTNHNREYWKKYFNKIREINHESYSNF